MKSLFVKNSQLKKQSIESPKDRGDVFRFFSMGLKSGSLLVAIPKKMQSNGLKPS